MRSEIHIGFIITSKIGKKSYKYITVSFQTIQNMTVLDTGSTIFMRS